MVTSFFCSSYYVIITPQKFKELLSLVWEVSNHDGNGLEDGCLLKAANLTFRPYLLAVSSSQDLLPLTFLLDFIYRCCANIVILFVNIRQFGQVIQFFFYQKCQRLDFAREHLFSGWVIISQETTVYVQVKGEWLGKLNHIHYLPLQTILKPVPASLK